MDLQPPLSLDWIQYSMNAAHVRFEEITRPNEKGKSKHLAVHITAKLIDHFCFFPMVLWISEGSTG